MVYSWIVNIKKTQSAVKSCVPIFNKISESLHNRPSLEIQWGGRGITKKKKAQETNIKRKWNFS